MQADLAVYILYFYILSYLEQSVLMTLHHCMVHFQEPSPTLFSLSASNTS